MRFLPYSWYENSMWVFLVLRVRECLIHMPLTELSMMNKSDLFQLSISAEIHTFPCSQGL